VTLPHAAPYRGVMSLSMRAVVAGWVLLAVLAGGLGVVSEPGQRLMVGLVALWAVVPLTCATHVARRVPGNPCGPLLAAGAVALLSIVVPQPLTEGVLAGVWVLLYLPFALLLLLVPQGTVASRAWRHLAVGLTAVAGGIVAVCVVQAVAPSLKAPLEVAGVVLVLAFFVGLLASAVSPLMRFRRGDAGERTRLRWVFLGGAALPLTLLLCWASYLVLGTADLVVVGLAVLNVSLPVGVAIALTRPTLMDIDRASAATLTAGALATAVLGVLTVACVGVGSALVAWSAPLALGLTAVLAAAVALAAAPLYRAVDRLVFPARGRSVAAVRQLGVLIEAGRAQATDLEPTLRDTLRDPGLEVAFIRLSDAALQRCDGTPATVTEFSTPIRLHGETMGYLTASAAQQSRPPAVVARACAPLLDRARLQAELRAARADVTASRERLVRAEFQERRRLERDLHDGAQQRLVALGMRLRVLQRSAGVDGEAADALDAAVAELGTAVAELRQLAHGVRPSALDDGLPAALSEIAARTPGLVDLDVHAPDVPDDVAVTAYFVVTEAVTNALKHAQPERIRVVVRAEDAGVHVTVADDGCGGVDGVADGQRGLGHLRDRVDALGGTLTVVSPVGHGTRVEAVLPCG